jgi:hypothetical protein
MLPSHTCPLAHVGTWLGMATVGSTENLIREKIKSSEKLHPHISIGEILNLRPLPPGFGCPSGLLMGWPNLA